MRSASGRRLGHRAAALTAAAARPVVPMSAERAYTADDVTYTTTGAPYSTVGGGLLRRELPDPAGGTGALPEAGILDSGRDRTRVRTIAPAAFAASRSPGDDTARPAPVFEKHSPAPPEK